MLKKDRWNNIPWGFEEDPEDTKYIRPIVKQLEALDYIAEALQREEFSYTEGAEWLVFTTDRPLTASGLRKIIATRY